MTNGLPHATFGNSSNLACAARAGRTFRRQGLLDGEHRGGVKGGHRHGATDDHGTKAVEMRTCVQPCACNESIA